MLVCNELLSPPENHEPALAGQYWNKLSLRSRVWPAWKWKRGLIKRIF